MAYGSDIYRDSSGRLPPETYRRRRLAVVVLMCVVMGLTTWAFARGDGGSAATGEQPPPDPKPAAAPQPSTEPPKPRPTVTVTVTSTPKATATVTATPKRMGKPCSKVGATLVVRTDDNAYAGDKKPEFTVRIKPKKRCLLDTDKLQFVVKSGTDRIWSTRDCPGADHWPRRITPRNPYVSDLAWDRERSNPAKCGQKTGAAKAGWYVVTAKLGDRASNEATFRLK